MFHSLNSLHEIKTLLDNICPSVLPNIWKQNDSFFRDAFLFLIPLSMILQIELPQVRQ